MSIQSDIDALIDEFDFLGDWEERYRYLIEMGQALPGLSEAERTEQAKVKGCVSQVWVYIDIDNGAVSLRGDSDAHIVQGLVALLSRLYNGRSPSDILEIDPKAILSKIGLSEHLSPQRSNGLASMITRIRAEASALINA